MRASGDGISDEAHQAIEEIFAERGERLPAKPKTPIVIAEKQATPRSGNKRLLIGAAIGVLAAIAVATQKTLAEELSHTWYGVLGGFGVIIYFVIKWFRRQMLSSAQREREDNEKKAREDGLTEIMVCAANGDLERIREVVEYGGDVNARSISGTTALMYAAKNNHLAIVEFLLAAGADPKLKSNKGSSATDIARKCENLEIVARLEQYGTR